MLTKVAFGLGLALVTVSGALAQGVQWMPPGEPADFATRPAVGPAQNVYSPAGHPFRAEPGRRRGHAN
jgi:hypothetical protein